MSPPPVKLYGFDHCSDAAKSALFLQSVSPWQIIPQFPLGITAFLLDFFFFFFLNITVPLTVVASWKLPPASDLN